MASDSLSKHVKVIFPLEKDEDDYPPDDYEGVWAEKNCENNYLKIDNIPFFVRGISLGDLVSVRERDSELQFDKVIKASGHSTVRVVFFDLSQVSIVRKFVENIGGSSEKSHLDNLLAIDIPPNIDYQNLVEFLDKGEQGDKWEYEESCLQN